MIYTLNMEKCWLFRWAPVDMGQIKSNLLLLVGYGHAQYDMDIIYSSEHASRLSKFYQDTDIQIQTIKYPLTTTAPQFLVSWIVMWYVNINIPFT